MTASLRIAAIFVLTIAIVSAIALAADAARQHPHRNEVRSGTPNFDWEVYEAQCETLRAGGSWDEIERIEREFEIEECLFFGHRPGDPCSPRYFNAG